MSGSTKQGAMGGAGAGGDADGDGNALLLGPCSCCGTEGAIQCTVCKQVRVTRVGQCCLSLLRLKCSLTQQSSTLLVCARQRPSTTRRLLLTRSPRSFPSCGSLCRCSAAMPSASKCTWERVVTWRDHALLRATTSRKQHRQRRPARCHTPLPHHAQLMRSHRVTRKEPRGMNVCTWCAAPLTMPLPSTPPTSE
jgi:hypothetical protein